MRIAASVTNRIRNNREKRFEQAAPSSPKKNNEKDLEPPSTATLNTASNNSEHDNNSAPQPVHRIPADDTTISSAGDPCLIQEAAAPPPPRPAPVSRVMSHGDDLAPRNPRLERLERMEREEKERKEKENKEKQAKSSDATPKLTNKKSPTFKRSRKQPGQKPPVPPQPQHHHVEIPVVFKQGQDMHPVELANRRKAAYELYRSCGKISRDALKNTAFSLGVMDPQDVDLLPWTPDGRFVDREMLREIVAQEQDALEEMTQYTYGTDGTNPSITSAKTAPFGGSIDRSKKSGKKFSLF